jgi:hypothetical protein
MPIHNNEKVMNTRRKARRDEQKERRRETKQAVDKACFYLMNGNYRNEKIYSYTEFIKEKFPAIHKEIIKVLFEDPELIAAEKRRIYNLLRVRDIIPEDRLEEVLEYREFLNNL